MALTLRNVKGSELTYTEMDANLTGLSNGTNWAAAVGAASVLTLTKPTAGDALIFTNGGASNKVGYLYTDAQYVSLGTGPGATADLVALDAANHKIEFWVGAAHTNVGQFTAAGFLKASDDGTFISATGSYHELRSDNGANYTARVSSKHAATPFGLNINFTAAAPNGTGNSFMVCEDNAATRAELRSNGGLANFSANNVNLSDARAKTLGTPAPSYWDFVESLSRRLQRKAYADDPSRRLHTMIDAQDVEALDAEVVSPWRAGKLALWKGVSEHEIQMRTLGVVGELQRRVMALESKAH